MEKEEPRQSHGNQESNWVAAVAAASVAAFLAYFLYFTLIRPAPPGGPGSWAEFGDFFGGVVNPVIGIVTVMLVVRTLRATRQEARDTRIEMNLQTKHFQHEQRLNELQKRLDGALSAWNTLLEQVRPKLRNRLLGETAVNSESLGDLLRHPRTRTAVQNLVSAGRWTEFSPNWSNFLDEEVNLLIEIARYCEDYEQEAGNRILTDFYRRRVNHAVRILELGQLLPNGIAEKLRVGRYIQVDVA